MPPILNMLGLVIWRSFEYASFLKGVEYTKITLSIPEKIEF